MPEGAQDSGQDYLRGKGVIQGDIAGVVLESGRCQKCHVRLERGISLQDIFIESKPEHLELRKKVLKEALWYFEPLLLFVNALHEKGLTYIDIKPANIVFHEDALKFIDIESICRRDDMATCGVTPYFLRGILPDPLLGVIAERGADIWEMGLLQRIFDDESSVSRDELLGYYGRQDPEWKLRLVMRMLHSHVQSPRASTIVVLATLTYTVYKCFEYDNIGTRRQFQRKVDYRNTFQRLLCRYPSIVNPIDALSENTPLLKDLVHELGCPGLNRSPPRHYTFWWRLSRNTNHLYVAYVLRTGSHDAVRPTRAGTKYVLYVHVYCTQDLKRTRVDQIDLTNVHEPVPNICLYTYTKPLRSKLKCSKAKDVRPQDFLTRNIVSQTPQGSTTSFTCIPCMDDRQSVPMAPQDTAPPIDPSTLQSMQRRKEENEFDWFSFLDTFEETLLSSIPHYLRR